LGIIYSMVYPETFSTNNITLFLQKFGYRIWLAYIFITFIRGLFLFPSTPFVLAGAILFPDKLTEVWIISMAGILFSATLLYFFAEKVGFGEYLKEKHPEKINKIQQQLNKPQGKWMVAIWAWFPFIPTDIICYVAGLVKMRYTLMISGIFLGESILVSIYLYLGKDILSWIQTIN
jgi:uncharacterized membrane protein YdjX (TVP38/TMEM64 family)